MATIANSVNSVTVTNSTVDNAVGICYFDPISESLLEIGNLPNHYVSVNSYEQTVKKYYIVVSPGESLSYVKVKVSNKEEIEDHYSMKLMIANDSPTAEAFAALPDFNSFRVVNPIAGDFIPLWILVTSKAPVNDLFSMGLEIEYE